MSVEATADIFGAIQQQLGREFTSGERRVLSRLSTQTLGEAARADNIAQFFREHNYADFPGPPEPGPLFGPGFQPGVSSVLRESQAMMTRAFYAVWDEDRNTVTQDLIATSLETFAGRPELVQYAVRFFEGATREELQQLFNAGPSISMGGQFIEEARVFYQGVPDDLQQALHTGLHAAALRVVEETAQSFGAPAPIARQIGAAADIAGGYLYENRSGLLGVLAALSAKIRGGYRDHKKMAIAIGGLGLSGVYGVARHYLNDAEDFIEEIEEARQQGIVFGPEEETAIEKLKRYLGDVNTLGNAASENGQLISVDQTIVKSLIALNDAKTTPEREQHIQSLSKLTYVKEYQLAMYDRQLRNKSNISGAPPLVRPGKYGIRPIRITPDWRGAII